MDSEQVAWSPGLESLGSTLQLEKGTRPQALVMWHEQQGTRWLEPGDEQASGETGPRTLVSLVQLVPQPGGEKEPPVVAANQRWWTCSPGEESRACHCNLSPLCWGEGLAGHLPQGNCQMQEEAMVLRVGLWNNGFMHHVLETSKFKDVSPYFHFHVDEEMEGTSSKNKQLCSDFKLLENILAKWLLILPQEEDYGFNFKKKNKVVVLKLVQRGSLAEMTGLLEGRKMYSNNKDLVLLRPFSKVESLLNKCFCSHCPLHIWGAIPLCVYAVGSSSKAEAAGLSAGQCILKVNCSSMASEGALGVLKHFQAFQSCGQEALISSQTSVSPFVGPAEPQIHQSSAHLWDWTSGVGGRLASAVPVPLAEPARGWSSGHPTVENMDLESGVMCEYVCSMGIWYHMLERIMESCGCFFLTAKILEAFAADDSAFMQNCGWLMAMSSAIMIMSYSEFCNIFNTKLESIGQRITCYQQISAPPQLKSRVSPAFKQAALEPHVLCSLNFWPTNCHVNLMEVSNPKMTPSVGRSFSIQFRRMPSLIGLDPKQEGEWAMLEDMWVTLSELNSVTFSFKQLDENCVPNTNVFYHIEGSQQALKVVFYFNGYHFSKLPSRQENRASLQPHTVLFTKGAEIEALGILGLEKGMTFYLEPVNLPMDASTTAMKIDQLICPINAIDELCHLLKSFMHSKPGNSRSLGSGLLPVSCELCYHLGACQMAMCSTGMQRSILSVSLEQVAILAQNHGLLPKCIMQVTNMQKQERPGWTEGSCMHPVWGEVMWDWVSSYQLLEHRTLQPGPPGLTALSFQDPRVEILAKNVSVKDHMPQDAPWCVAPCPSSSRGPSTLADCWCCPRHCSAFEDSAFGAPSLVQSVPSQGHLQALRYSSYDIMAVCDNIPYPLSFFRKEKEPCMTFGMPDRTMK
ncbi:Phosphatidylinositol 3,4,5-trisphosphate-dependent Rac exchanger 1 protein [Sciurus carolinensis]|uniref:Phosphatidylinositol 3,4,5-trisphosphate-dependent Rac exchanger 1 protein n=1 Tax=Sciurus carolinensis TaxID=30640 RepID=A0AA41T500_SCICA|nr:Phosphatidylinositol 3,4,5-trisphosphate-dependent Rac exchanger 1 protein [Sciurus carolinensis]